VIPAEIRKKWGIGPGDFVEWKEGSEGIIVEFNKEVTFEDVYGMIKDVETDAVELKRKAQRGEKI
jgi:bifunctional DNA-binding transcriptional regulator/antitoxin component of YhaV-PrlF toxin-antitoxin module